MAIRRSLIFVGVLTVVVLCTAQMYSPHWASVVAHTNSTTGFITPTNLNTFVTNVALKAALDATNNLVSTNLFDSGNNVVLKAAGQFIGNGAGLSNTPAFSGTATNATEIRFAPITNGPGFGIVRGTGAPNSDGSYDETFQMAYNFQPTGGAYDTNQHKIKYGLESNFHATDNTNYAEFNLDFFSPEALSTNNRVQSWNCNLSNQLSSWGYAGYRHFWNYAGIGDGHIGADWILGPIANSNSFNFDGNLISDYSRIIDSGNYKASWFRSSNPDTWNNSTSELGYIGFIGSQFTFGRTNVGGPIGWSNGTTNVLQITASMADFTTTAYNQFFGYGNSPGNCTLRSTDGTISLMAFGSSKPVILTPSPGSYVQIEGGYLRGYMGSANYSIRLRNHYLLGGNTNQLAIAPLHNNVISTVIGQGADDGTRGSWMDFVNDGSTVFYITNYAPVMKIATNGHVTLRDTITATNGYFMPTNALTAWPATPRTHGEAYWGNSNGVVYLLTSVPGSLTWAATNKIAP